MSRIQVVTGALAVHAERLGQVSSGVRQPEAPIMAVGAAAHGTDAATAYADMTQRWIGALGQFGASTDALASAVAQAAECYAQADALAIPPEVLGRP